MGISGCRILVVLTLLDLGCAHQAATEAPAKDAYDAAYLGLRARQDGCPPRAVACCEGLKAKLDQALSGDRMADLALTLDAMAISCPMFGGIPIAALNHRPKRAAVAADDGVISVSYVLDLGPGDRVYWISDFVDGQLASRTPVSAGRHQVDVEIHVMTTGQQGSDQLHRVRGSAEVVVEAKLGAALTAVLKRLPGTSAQVPFALLLTDKWRGSRATSAAPAQEPSANPAVKPVIVPAQRLDFGKPRYPSEFSGAGEIAVLSKICMTEAGKVDSVTPLFTPHPRYTAMLVAGMFETRYRPATVDGRAVPSCHPVKLSID